MRRVFLSSGSTCVHKVSRVGVSKQGSGEGREKGGSFVAEYTVAITDESSR